MNHELMIVLAAVLLALPLGFFLARKRPGLAKGYLLWSLDRKWWFFFAAMLGFIALSAISFSGNRTVFGWLFAFFALLESYALVKIGFYRLPPNSRK